MEVDLQPIIISDLNCTVNPIKRTAGTNLQMGTRDLYRHLRDHDYLGKTTKRVLNKQRKHIKITELKALFNCTMCGYRTMDRDVLHKHTCIKNLRIPTKKIPKGFEKCPECNFYSDEPLVLGRQERNCSGSIIPKSNSTTFLYQCPNCNYATENPTSLKIHRHVHTRGTPYKCTECDFSGRDLKHLIQHYESAKDLRCKCGYTTHVKQHMVGHERVHTGEKPFRCGICNFGTKDRAGLHRHMKTKHVVD